MEKHNACERHDGRAARKDGGYGGKGATFLEKKEKRDRPGTDANASKQRIIEPSSTEFLIPSSRTPEDQQVDQDRQCGAGFDNETAETFTNAIGSKTGKDLMRAVEYGSNDRIPKPSCHESNLVYEMDHAREN